MFNIIKKYWFIFVVLLALIFWGWHKLKQTQNTNPNTKASNRILKRQDLKQTLSLTGKIDADEKATLRFQTSGRLDWIGVKKGDSVNKYQTLATLDVRDVRKNLEKKLNSYLLQRWDFEQTQDDYEGKIVTDSIKRILEKAQFNLNNSVLDVEIQNLSVEYAKLWTPIEGIVTGISAPYAGVNITPTTAEFEVINPKTVYLSLSADQNEVTSLKLGMNTQVVMDAYPEEKIDGTINSISFTPKSDETGTVYEVKIQMPVDNSDYRYKMGMTGDAIFTIKEVASVLAVPSNLVKHENDKKYLLKKYNGKKIKTYVQTGEEMDGNVEILSGANEGDVIYD